MEQGRAPVNQVNHVSCPAQQAEQTIEKMFSVKEKNKKNKNAITWPLFDGHPNTQAIKDRPIESMEIR